jgi:hypothetical protein
VTSKWSRSSGLGVARMVLVATCVYRAVVFKLLCPSGHAP